MKKDVIIAVLVTFALTITLFTVIPINSQSVGDYDHWLDINDDGTIDMKDIASVARAYGTDGTAINKTELLLDLEERVAYLELIGQLYHQLRVRVDNLERVSFFEDFNDGVLDGWTFKIYDNWYLEPFGAGYRIRGGSGVVTVDGINITDCLIETTLIIQSGFRAGIITRYVNDTDYCFFFLSEPDDEVGVYNPSKGMLNSTGQYTYPIYEDWAYNLKAVIDENTYSLSINGTEVISGINADLATGKVGLYVDSASAWFDDFRVTELL